MSIYIIKNNDNIYIFNCLFMKEFIYFLIFFIFIKFNILFEEKILFMVILSKWNRNSLKYFKKIKIFLKKLKNFKI